MPPDRLVADEGLELPQKPQEILHILPAAAQKAAQ